jgi:hypothetical protein
LEFARGRWNKNCDEKVAKMRKFKAEKGLVNK